MNRVLTSLLLTCALGLTATTAAADVGAKAYKKCASCHGEDGKGQTKMGQKLNVKDLTGAAIQAKSDADLEKQISEGNKAKKMPAYKSKLSPEEIKAVVKYIRGLKK